MLALLLLFGLGAVVLERVGLLPDPAAAVVRRGKAWLVPVLQEAGLDLPDWLGETGTPSPPQRTDDRGLATEALALLDRVPVRAERQRGYAREDWPHWRDLDGDCLDARQEVLVVESLEPVRLDTGGCRVVGGFWRDLYTGETFTDPQALDVDHFVPLAEAHRSGGHAWGRERRAAFANDLDDSRSLIAVSAFANRSKGDQGPEEWLPPQEAYHCRYVAAWVAVKVRWSLSMDERERVTAGNLLRPCAGD